MGGYSQQFAVDLLKALGYPTTSENLRFLAAWARAEGGHATYNPFNTTEHWSGATSYNSVGVRNYPSYQAGLQATIATLRNGRYGGILSGLQSGSSAMTTARALAASPWGTGSLVEKVLGGSGGSSGGSVDTGGVGVSTAAAGGAPKPDKLSMATLADNYGWEEAFLNSIPELKSLLIKSFNDPAGQWTTQKFQIALEQTKWWKTHSSDLRQAALQATEDPATYQANIAKKQQDIAALAGGMGAGLSPTTLHSIATRAYTMGMDEAQIRGILANYIAYSKNGALAGDAAQVGESLKQIAYNNGVKLSDYYVLRAARLVEAGHATGDSFAENIRAMAAGAFPQFAQQIKAGMNMSDIASPYVQSMAQTLEMDPAKIDLFDPTIRKALSGSPDPKTGVATPQTLWQFENGLRSDPRWMKTDNARESLMGAGHSVLSDFGLSF